MISVFPLAHQPVNFLILSAGTAGDMHPFLALACALKKRCHHITFFCPEIHRHLVELVGIDCKPMGNEREYLAILNDPNLWHPRKGIELVLRNTGFAIEELLVFFNGIDSSQKQVILAHPLTLAATAVIRHTFPSLHIVAVYLAPSNLRSIENPLTFGPLKIPRWMPSIVRKLLWRLIDRYVIDPAALPAVNALRRRYGLQGVKHYVDHSQSVPDLSVTLFPTWFGPTQPDWPRPLHSGYFPVYDPKSSAAVNPELKEFLASGSAPLIFTHGTGNRHAAHYFRCALEAAENLGRRAIFLTADRLQLPALLPADILWQPYVSFSALLPHSVLLIHHGGIGTTAEALKAGTPQLVVPLGFDQFDNAARIEYLNAGSSLSYGKVNAKSLTSSLESMLQPSIYAACKNRCRELAEKFSPDKQAEDTLCQAIETSIGMK